MKSTFLKLVASLVLAVTSTYIGVAPAHADSFVRPGEPAGQLGNTAFPGFDGEFYSLPGYYAHLNDAGFGDVFFMRYDAFFGISFVGMRSTKKETGRDSVVKLQRLTNSQNDTREDLVLPSKAAAKEFCGALIKAAQWWDKEEAMPTDLSVYASGWLLASKKHVIAVGYRLPFEYHGAYQGQLTPATKYWMCPNPWNWEQDLNVADENDAAGVKASGLSSSEWFNADTDINGRYHVICMDPKMPETDFFWYPFGIDGVGRWVNETYQFRGDRASLENLNATLGALYCAGQLQFK